MDGEGGRAEGSKAGPGWTWAQEGQRSLQNIAPRAVVRQCLPPPSRALWTGSLSALPCVKPGACSALGR